MLSRFIVGAQDSSYYFPLWTPEYQYQKAGVIQEGIFYYRYKNGVLSDSTLAETIFYDSLGRIIKQNQYKASKLFTSLAYHYSKNGLDSIVLQYKWLPVKIVQQYTYDTSGRISLQETLSNGKKTMQKRYAYNSFSQLSECYTQVTGQQEVLAEKYYYRSDKLLQKAEYFGNKSAPSENYSLFYGYTNNKRTVTHSFQLLDDDKRYVDCIKTYNGARKLVEKVNPPLRKGRWLPLHTSPRKEEEIETMIYLENGLLFERQIRRNEKLVLVERHFYL